MLVAKVKGAKTNPKFASIVTNLVIFPKIVGASQRVNHLRHLAKAQRVNQEKGPRVLTRDPRALGKARASKVPSPKEREKESPTLWMVGTREPEAEYQEESWTEDKWPTEEHPGQVNKALCGQC